MSDLGEIAGHEYRVISIPVETQFHIARRLLKAIAPAGEIIVQMLPRVIQALEASGAEEGAAREALFKASELVTPLAEAIGNLSDEDSEYILHNCLAHAERLATGGTTWSRVWQRNGGYRFADINLPTLVRLTVLVINDQLSSFFPAALS